MQYRILFLDTNHPSLLSSLRAYGFTCDEDYLSSKEAIQNKISFYDAIVIRSRFKIDQQFIEAATKLKCIARAGAGMENIDVVFAEQRGIKCVHAPEGNRDAVGEHAIGMLLSLMNNLCRADKQMREGKWLREANRGYELQGKTVGVIGFGNMGSAFVKKLSGFDVKILVYDKYKTNFGTDAFEESSLVDLFNHADILSLHIPLTDETNYMVNDKFLSNFKKPIWLINTSRGKIIETSALVKNMECGKVRGACLDVLEFESSSFEKMDSGKMSETIHYLINSDNVIQSPHIAGWTFESHEKIALTLVQKIKDTLID